MIFDKVYIISFVFNSEKRKKISEYLINQLNIINFEFIYGIDPTISNIKDINIYDSNMMYEPYKFKDGYSRNDGYYMHDISCNLAHLTIYQLALSEGYEKILIIEDDALFVISNNIILEYFNNIPQDANIIYYGYIFMHGETQKYNNLYNKIIDDSHVLMAGMQCYAICNKETLKKLIEYQKQVFHPSDQYINDIINNCYISINSICIDPIHNK